ncbi:hypothetical protein [Natrinema altunense]|uniref:hypothetical protein n=1 Tax=Natrinema altunense TaxID=222984 RepID=UPI001F5E2761|nr:hypothetical protein [Natrinema altunense]
MSGTRPVGNPSLERATRIDDGTVLALAWEPGELSDDAVGKFLSWIMTKLYRPPSAVPCETVDRATAVRAYLQELLAAYDGRTI